jgi:hypothetical protein
LPPEEHSVAAQEEAGRPAGADGQGAGIGPGRLSRIGRVQLESRPGA